MNLLFVAHTCPWPPDTGMHQRLYFLLDALAGRHQVTLVAPAPAEAHDRPALADRIRIIEVPAESSGSVAERQRYGLWAPVKDRVMALVSSTLPNSVREQWNTSLLQTLRDLRRDGPPFDATWAHRTQCAEMARQAGFTNVVVDLDDIDTIRLQRTLRHSPWYVSKPLHYAELAKQYLYERSVPRRFWRAAVCKEDDRLFFPGRGTDVFVVPNGVPSLTRSDPAAEKPGELVFVGTMHYPPNVDAVRWFNDAMLPLIAAEVPDVRFRIVGKAPVPAVVSLHDGLRCVVHPDVPDVTPYYDEAAVVVAPIRLGSGTRLKVLEALARGKALVATSVAVEGLDLRPGIDFELADGTAEFAAGCVRLLRSADARRRLGDSGRTRVLERYTWDAAGGAADRAIAGARA